jgi:peptide-methionine (S)-S-oxide reductase
MDRILFGGGCFWGVENAFGQVEGVADVVSGYSGGHVDNPSYEQVCTGSTDHAEVVEVSFDPEKVTVEQLLDLFWKIHDPTQINRQGPDVGSQYRSVIFCTTEAQLDAARASKQALEDTGRFPYPVVTEIAGAGAFWPAEEHHQHYFEKLGIAPTCHTGGQ